MVVALLAAAPLLLLLGVAAGVGANKPLVDVVVDCDSGLYAPLALDVDDDLALAYLSRRAVVHAVTTTHGNSLARWTCQSASKVVSELDFTRSGLFDNPVQDPKTAKAPDADKEKHLEALSRLRDLLKEQPKVHCGGSYLGSPYPSASNKLNHLNSLFTILALGALTNVAAAIKQSPVGVKSLKKVVFMGGRFENDGYGYLELNMAADGAALTTVLADSLEKTVLPVNLLREVVLTEGDISRLIHSARGRWISQHSSALKRHATLASFVNPWFFNGSGEGFHPWDVVAAVFVTHPEFFHDIRCHPAQVSRRAGLVAYLDANWTAGVPGPCRENRGHINMPHSLDAALVKQEILEGLRGARGNNNT